MCVWVFAYVVAGWMHFGQKLKESTSENLQVCWRTHILGSPHFNYQHTEEKRKKPSSVRPKNWWEKKEEIIGVLKRYPLTPKHKNSQRFLKTFVL